ncbi:MULTISPECIES: type II toxin-antitoxin system Phd/YefM family antitoxin [unclassified Ectothiorhodospira]|uniref:type II toxin-antitoxin system Phd/YefM family antitoxin n=1 Tax=unclassified Ectothiorhodospira TaxID=2684909 RepID=UPI001EE8975A|nr:MULTISPECIES: type II toxin-antitoxin system prevent-host-death family antitoxin [unclassified Ectothiorhodospira]MCG5514541.1 type II toxin-antitoxin system prevent-host-death family antitoxin [Ectothiorhodospira sp. 9100]MCG5518655.1 type II toxin-antitoxin system prevent-host-death family antitoxin [Ectothiorhodospira sp. 9905]
MDTVNIHEAKTQLSRLLARAAMGETVIIAKAGHPIAKLTPIDTPPASKARRLGFLKGAFQIPNDFDTMGSDEIAKIFDGDDRS